MVYRFCRGFLLLFSLTLSSLAAAALLDGRLHGNMMHMPIIPRIQVEHSAPVISRNGTVLPPYDTIYYFDQLIDHNNPSLGTFKQRYWHTYEWYEPGGPVILTTFGEGNAEGGSIYLTNISMNGLIAQRQNGTTIILEHRFFGLSNPRPDLSVESFKLHTLEQSVKDFVYFANNVKLPMPGGDQLQPHKAPWILFGGSYAGALISWTMVEHPGVFFAGYAVSAVVQAILDYWKFYEPIRNHMARNCSADIEAVIAHVDKVLLGRDTTAIRSLKDGFGMGDVKHNDDFAGALRNNLADWQLLDVTSKGGRFLEFCDALEVKDGQPADDAGWGLEHALVAWGDYFKTKTIPSICGPQDVETCFGTYNTSQAMWTNTTVNNSQRSWLWLVCNQVGYYQEGPPHGHPSLVSRLANVPYELRQCSQMFPGAFQDPYTVQDAQRRVAQTNHVYHGWDLKVPRLFFSNGIRDPWREATVSATDRKVRSTFLQPVALSDGFHGSDYMVDAGLVDPTVAAVQEKVLKFMRIWLAMWKPRNP